MTPFEYIGEWWLPEDTEKKITGVLQFDGLGHPKLKLYGSLGPTQRGFGGGKPFSPEIILGFTEDGKLVTLYDCAQSGSVLSFPGISKSNFVATYAILGAHFASKNELRFEKFWIRYDRLLDWTQLTGFTQDYEHEQNTITGITAQWRRPSAHEVSVAGWGVKFWYGWKNHGDSEAHLHLEHRISLEVRPPEPKPLDAFLRDFAYHYRNFVTLGLGTPIYETELYAQPVPREEENRPLEVYYLPIKWGAQSRRKTHDMLFSFHDIVEDYAGCLERWFSRAELLRPVFGLYFGRVYSEPGYLEPEFLAFAQALESYHASVFPRHSYLGPEKYKSIKSALAKALKAPELNLSDDVLQIYLSKLNYFDRLVLRTRVREVVESLGEAARLLIPDAVSFANLLTDTRNYLTHHDEALRKRSATGEDLWLLIQQTRFLLELCFLREIGLSDERILAITSDHQQYLFLRSQLRQKSSP